MNKTAISQRRLNRFIEANRIVLAADADSLMQKALGMSEAERWNFIRNFVKQNGIEKVKSIVENVISVITNVEEGKRTIASDNPSKLKQLFTSGEKWSVLLTFILLWAAMSTSDYYSLAIKSPNLMAELKAFLLPASSAFTAWIFNVLKNKVK